MICLARAQTARSQWASRIDRTNPIAKNIAAAIRMDSLFDAVSGKLYESGRVGTRKVVGGPGVGRGFGSAVGAGTTDSMVAPPPVTSDKRSYLVRAKVNGFGGGGFGRFLNDITDNEQFYVSSVDGLVYFRVFGSGRRSAIATASAVSNLFGQVASFSVSFDASLQSNQPELYINGTRIAFNTVDGVPYGAVMPTGNICIGNRISDNARNFDGVIYDFLAFDRMLLPAEHAALHANLERVYRRRKPLIGVGVTVQIARPIADLSNTGWVPSTGTDLYPMIGETVRDDATFIAATFPGALYECTLSSIGDPNVSTDHSLPPLVLSAPGGGGITVRLRQGTTTIAAWTYHPGPTPTEYTPTLSGAEADSITDYTALRLQFEAIA